MASGRLFHRNHALEATFSGGTWDRPLANLINRRLVSAPARCIDATNPASPQALVDLGKRRFVTGLGLFATTLQRSAQFQAIACEDATVEADGSVTPIDVTWDSGWRDVFQRIHRTADLDYEDSNWWDGKAEDALLDAYGRQLVLPVPAGVSTRYLVLRFDNAGVAEFDLGYLYVARPWVPFWTYEYGRELPYEGRSLVDETPGGVEVLDNRPGRRRQRVTFPFLSRAEANQLIDMRVRNGLAEPVVFVPDIDDAANLYREAFLATATFSSPPTETHRNGEWSASLDLQEIIG